MDSDIIWLPHDEGFHETLIQAWNLLHGRISQYCVIGVDGMPRSVDENELTEYLDGGEYQERQSLIAIPEVVGLID